MNASLAQPQPLLIGEGLLPLPMLHLQVAVSRSAIARAGAGSQLVTANDAASAAAALNATAGLVDSLAAMFAEQVGCTAVGGSAAARLVFGPVSARFTTGQAASSGPGNSSWADARALRFVLSLPIISLLDVDDTHTVAGDAPLQPVLLSCSLRAPAAITSPGTSSAAVSPAITQLNVTGICPNTPTVVPLLDSGIAFVWAARLALPQRWAYVPPPLGVAANTAAGSAAAAGWPCNVVDNDDGSVAAQASSVNTSASALLCGAGTRAWFDSVAARTVAISPLGAVPVTLRGRSVLSVEWTNAADAADAAAANHVVAPFAFAEMSQGNGSSTASSTRVVALPLSTDSVTSSGRTALLLPQLSALCSSSSSQSALAQATVSITLRRYGSRILAPLRRSQPPCADMSLLLSATALAVSNSRGNESSARLAADSVEQGVCAAAASAAAVFASSLQSASPVSALLAASDATASALSAVGAQAHPRTAVAACPPLCSSQQLDALVNVFATGRRRLTSTTSSFGASAARTAELVAAAALVGAVAAGGIRGSDGKRLSLAPEDVDAVEIMQAAIAGGGFQAAAGFRITRPCMLSTAPTASGSGSAGNGSAFNTAAAAASVALATAVCTNASDPRSAGSAGICAYGEGEECIPCPAGGLCPGGYVLWSAPGWYVRSQDSQQLPLRCAYPATLRCTGWNVEAGTTSCGAGYAPGSFACGSCADSWYSDPGGTGSCVPCPPAEAGESALRTAVAAFMVVTAATMAVVTVLSAVSIAVARCVGGSIRGAIARAVAFAVAAFMTLQSAAQAANAAPPDAPPLLRSIFRALRALQFQGISPLPLACVNTPPFAVPEALLAASIFLAVLWSASWTSWFARLTGPQKNADAGSSSSRALRRVGASAQGSAPKGDVAARLRAAAFTSGLPAAASKSPAQFRTGSAEASQGASAASKPARCCAAAATEAARCCAGPARRCPALVGLGGWISVTVLSLLYAIAANVSMDMLICRSVSMSVADYRLLPGADGSSIAAQLEVTPEVALLSPEPELLAAVVTVQTLPQLGGWPCGEGEHARARALAIAALAIVVLAIPIASLFAVRASIRAVLSRSRVPHALLAAGLPHVMYGAAFSDKLLARARAAAAAAWEDTWRATAPAAAQKSTAGDASAGGGPGWRGTACRWCSRQGPSAAAASRASGSTEVHMPPSAYSELDVLRLAAALVQLRRKAFILRQRSGTGADQLIAPSTCTIAQRRGRVLACSSGDRFIVDSSQASTRHVALGKSRDSDPQRSQRADSELPSLGESGSSSSSTSKLTLQHGTQALLFSFPASLSLIPTPIGSSARDLGSGRINLGGSMAGGAGGGSSSRLVAPVALAEAKAGSLRDLSHPLKAGALGAVVVKPPSIRNLLSTAPSRVASSGVDSSSGSSGGPSAGAVPHSTAASIAGAVKRQPTPLGGAAASAAVVRATSLLARERSAAAAATAAAATLRKASKASLRQSAPGVAAGELAVSLAGCSCACVLLRCGCCVRRMPQGAITPADVVDSSEALRKHARVIAGFTSGASVRASAFTYTQINWALLALLAVMRTLAAVLPATAGAPSAIVGAVACVAFAVQQLIVWPDPPALQFQLLGRVLALALAAATCIYSALAAARRGVFDSSAATDALASSSANQAAPPEPGSAENAVGYLVAVLALAIPPMLTVMFLAAAAAGAAEERDIRLHVAEGAAAGHETAKTMLAEVEAKQASTAAAAAAEGAAAAADPTPDATARPSHESAGDGAAPQASSSRRGLPLLTAPAASSEVKTPPLASPATGPVHVIIGDGEGFTTPALTAGTGTPAGRLSVLLASRRRLDSSRDLFSRRSTGMDSEFGRYSLATLGSDDAGFATAAPSRSPAHSTGSRFRRSAGRGRRRGVRKSPRGTGATAEAGLDAAAVDAIDLAVSSGSEGASTAGGSFFYKDGDYEDDGSDFYSDDDDNAGDGAHSEVHSTASDATGTTSASGTTGAGSDAAAAAAERRRRRRVRPGDDAGRMRRRSTAEDYAPEQGARRSYAGLRSRATEQLMRRLSRASGAGRRKSALAPARGASGRNLGGGGSKPGSARDAAGAASAPAAPVDSEGAGALFIDGVRVLLEDVAAAGAATAAIVAAADAAAAGSGSARGLARERRLSRGASAGRGGGSLRGLVAAAAGSTAGVAAVGIQDNRAPAQGQVGAGRARRGSSGQRGFAPTPTGADAAVGGAGAVGAVGGSGSGRAVAGPHTAAAGAPDSARSLTSQRSLPGKLSRSSSAREVSSSSTSAVMRAASGELASRSLVPSPGVAAAGAAAERLQRTSLGGSSRLLRATGGLGASARDSCQGAHGLGPSTHTAAASSSHLAGLLAFAARRTTTSGVSAATSSSFAAGAGSGVSAGASGSAAGRAASASRSAAGLARGQQEAGSATSLGRE